MLCGFMAILYIVERIAPNAGTERYHYAIWLILAACVFDVLDGRLARMGGQDSPFGREFDSLADIVSFGIAPALLVHDIVLANVEQTWPGLGWLIACGYLVCGAMRLARFNCLAAMDIKSTSNAFRGCPIPAAAGVIASLTLFLNWLNGSGRDVGNWKYALPPLMILLSFLMVSDIEYPSFKSLNFRTKKPIRWVLVAIILAACTIRFWQWMPALIFVSYLAYGLVRPWVSRKWQREIEDEEDSLEDAGNNVACELAPDLAVKKNTDSDAAI